MPVLHSFKPEPFVKVAKFKRMVDTASLSKERKQLLWAGIKHLDPALADLLQLKSGLTDLIKNTDASVLFSQADFDRFTKAGRLVIGESNNGNNFTRSIRSNKEKTGT